MFLSDISVNLRDVHSTSDNNLDFGLNNFRDKIVRASWPGIRNSDS